mmetsp:Transcript_5109/g.10196  ORF Transcript_5109/g.10196 Transcript_5109/m.10196 type:complete len:216 (+) Transcript_5109:174-821(+)
MKAAVLRASVKRLAVCIGAAAVGVRGMTVLADPLAGGAQVREVHHRDVGVGGRPVHGFIEEQVTAAHSLRRALVEGCRTCTAGIPLTVPATLMSTEPRDTIPSAIVRYTIEVSKRLWLHRANNVVVQEHTTVACANDRNIVATGHLAADMYNHASQLEKSARRLLAIGAVGTACGSTSAARRPVLHNLQLQRKDDPVGKATTTAQLLHILEAFQV